MIVEFGSSTVAGISTTGLLKTCDNRGRGILVPGLIGRICYKNVTGNRDRSLAGYPGNVFVISLR